MLFDYSGRNVPENEEMSAECHSLIMEGAMLDTMDNTDISMFLENYDEVNAAISEEVVTEKTIVRLDKKAKLSKAHKAAIFAIAKERKDKLFNKLVWCWKLERFIEAKLEKKYGNEAMRRAKKLWLIPKILNPMLLKKLLTKLRACSTTNNNAGCREITFTYHFLLT